MKINTHNESLKGDRKFALQVKNTYGKLLKDLSSKVRLDQKAALPLLEKMAEQNAVLYHLGFYLTDNGRQKYD